MKVVTMATHNERMLDILNQSVSDRGMKLEIFGWGEVWKNYGTKLHLFNQHIQQYNDNEIILFMDAYDTILLANEDEIITKYNQLNSTLSVKKRDLIFSNGSNLMIYPLNKILLQMNSGMFIGRGGKIKELLSRICKEYDLEKEGSCDVILERYKDEYYIDDENELFYNYYFDGCLKDIFTDQLLKNDIIVRNKRLYVRGKVPLAIHFPKNSMNKKIILDLGYNYKEKIDFSCKRLLKDFNGAYLKYVLIVLLKIFIVGIIIYIFYKLINKK
jgi:hypothetical protein